MARLIENAFNSVMDLLFGKKKAVTLGPPGQEAAGRQLKSGAPIPKERPDSDDPGYQLDFTDSSDPEVRPTYGSWDKIE